MFVQPRLKNMLIHDLYSKSLLFQLKTQFQLIKEAACLGQKSCSIVANETDLFVEKMTKLGYTLNMDIDSANYRTCNFANPNEPEITKLENLVPEYILLNEIYKDDGVSKLWKILFRTAKHALQVANKRRTELSEKIAAKFYEYITRSVVKCAENGNTWASYGLARRDFKAHHSKKFKGVRLNQILPAIDEYHIVKDEDLMDDIENEPELRKYNIQFSWKLCQDLRDDILGALRRLFSANLMNLEGVIVVDNASEHQYLFQFNLRWEDGESYFRDLEKYQPNGEGFQEKKDHFEKMTGKTLNTFIHYGCTECENSNTTLDVLYKGFVDWANKHNITDFETQEEFKLSLSKLCGDNGFKKIKLTEHCLCKTCVHPIVSSTIHMPTTTTTVRKSMEFQNVDTSLHSGTLTHTFYLFQIPTTRRKYDPGYERNMIMSHQKRRKTKNKRDHTDKDV